MISYLYLLAVSGEWLIGHLLDDVCWHFNEELELILTHLPLVDEEAWGDGQELLKVGLSEWATIAALNHLSHYLKWCSPHIVSGSVQFKVSLKLLE